MCEPSLRMLFATRPNFFGLNRNCLRADCNFANHPASRRLIVNSTHISNSVRFTIRRGAARLPAIANEV